MAVITAQKGSSTGVVPDPCSLLQLDYPNVSGTGSIGSSHWKLAAQTKAISVKSQSCKEPKGVMNFTKLNVMFNALPCFVFMLEPVPVTEELLFCK